MKKGIAPAFPVTNPAGGATNQPTGNLNVSQHITPQALSKMDLPGAGVADESAIQQINPDNKSPMVLNMQRAVDKEKVNENFVKTKIDSMCGCPKKEKMTFYNKD